MIPQQKSCENEWNDVDLVDRAIQVCGFQVVNYVLDNR